MHVAIHSHQNVILKMLKECNANCEAPIEDSSGCLPRGSLMPLVPLIVPRLTVSISHLFASQSDRP